MISVCVATYRAHPAPNLASLAAALPAALGGEDGELCVALNGIPAAAAGAPAGARLVLLSLNTGVAPGWNAAATRATGDVLVFANDDCEPGPGAFAQLATALRDHPGAGIVGPVGTLWDLQTGAHVDHVSTERLPPGTLVPCDVVSGFCFAVRRETYDALGGFDETYAPLSWEEVDFCVAARVAGLENHAVAGVEVAHEWGVSAKAPVWRRIAWGGRRELLWSIHRRNRRHFLAKWAGRAPESVRPAPVGTAHP